MQSICFLVAFGACIIGKICGMGGGVIIKPALDALGIMQVAEINFLSGCTVLGMTCWSVGKSMVQHESQIDLSISTPLAIGAAVGGMAGKQLFSAVAGLFVNADTAGGIQAALLCTATFATLLYTIRKDRLTMLQVRNPAVCVLIGLGLGMLGTFLGIGGGPFNMAVLFFFFSMPTKVAAQNSLYIILISQSVGIITTAVTDSIPTLSIILLCGMVLCGVLGSEAGGRINKRLSDRQATLLFEGSMLLVMVLSACNIYRFLLK